MNRPIYRRPQCTLTADEVAELVALRDGGATWKDVGIRFNKQDQICKAVYDHAKATPMDRTYIWTSSYLAFIAELTPPKVLIPNDGGFTPQSRNEWRWISFARRLVWHFGIDGGLERLNA